MTQCIGIKPDKSLCQNIAKRGSDYCPAHDPARADARRRSASKAARSKRPHQEISDIKEQVHQLVEGVRGGKLDRQDAVVCGQLYNVILRAITTGLKVKEQEEIESRLEELEELVENQSRQDSSGRSRPW